MFRILGIIGLLATLALAGCTPEQRAANIAKAKAVLTAINNGAIVTAAAVRDGIDAACSMQAEVYASAQTTRSVFLLQTGPNTTQNIDNLDRALVAYNNACAAAANPASGSDLGRLLRVAISAYNSVNAAMAAKGG